MLDEIRQKLKLDDNQIHQITAFLREYEFVTMDETRKEMKLQETVRKFLT